MRLRAAEEELARLQEERSNATGEDVVELDDTRVLQEVGIYNYHHPLENAEAYRERLQQLQERLKRFVLDGKAILASDMFTFNNSLAKGRKMTVEFSKLMLRAYNAEADNCVRALRAGNVLTAKKRLESSVTAIAKLGAMMEMRINPDYHQLRLRELELTADHLMKVQVEKEEAREERERLREERKAEQELAAERARLDKEREHYLNALHALQDSDDQTAVADLNDRLRAIDQAIERNDYRTANIRAGYVYVISNRGSLGPNIVKIGLTRRLEPMERVRELGDASVPFPFDVHAMFFADDAVTVEADLHRAFADRRVNVVNQRREFFFATPAEVRTVLLEQVGNLLEFADEPEATQFLQSKKSWPTDTALVSGPGT
jgi:multidrug efflux pump subunit AcrA (membrane-fusion protein)